MRTNEHEILTEIGRIAGSIGKGLLAGLAGTAAITVSQMIEMKITNREQSSAPADAASKVLDVKPANEEKKEKMAQEVHWAYGTTWGAFRGILSEIGVEGWPATAGHFVAIWGAAMIVQPELAGSPPVTEWDAKTIATGGVHHAVYAITAGLVYDAINRSESCKWL